MTRQRLIVPALANHVARTPTERPIYGTIELHHNRATDVYRNAAYDAGLNVYDAAYQNNQALSPRFRAHLRQVVNLLNEHVRRNGKIVEVGCGKGAFLDLLAQETKFVIEGYDTAYEGLNRRIHKRYLTSADKIEADAIVLRHVLEYMPNPHAFLSSLKDIFGHRTIYIEVVAFDSILRKQSFLDINYERVTYFTQRALRRLFSGRAIAADTCFDGQYQYILANLGDLSDEFASAFADTREWCPRTFDALFPDLDTKLGEIESFLRACGRGYLWGASARACMLLAFAQGSEVAERLVGAIDINPQKVGGFLSGSGLPIYDTEYFFRHAVPRDGLIIVNAAYSSEIKATLENTPLRDIAYMAL